MPLLQIDFQEGFGGDAVVVRMSSVLLRRRGGSRTPLHVLRLKKDPEASSLRLLSKGELYSDVSNDFPLAGWIRC